MRHHHRQLATSLLLVLAAAGLPLALARSGPEPAPASSTAPESDFADIARVLRHPRCLNCHPSGDRPHVGDEARLHAMNVQRGEDGHGRIGQRCTACHRDENQEIAMVPGAPHWQLAPLSMAWEGLDDHDLAEALKDRVKNGDRSLADLRKHMDEDPLVLWGWEPGPGRAPVPLAHDAFIERLDGWIAGGAASPPPGVVSSF